MGMIWDGSGYYDPMAGQSGGGGSGGELSLAELREKARQVHPDWDLAQLSERELKTWYGNYTRKQRAAATQPTSQPAAADGYEPWMDAPGNSQTPSGSGDSFNYPGFSPPAGYSSWDAYLNGYRSGSSTSGGGGGGNVGSSWAMGSGYSNSGGGGSSGGSSGGGGMNLWGNDSSGMGSLDVGMQSGQILSYGPNPELLALQRWQQAQQQEQSAADRARNQRNLQIVLDRMKQMSDQANAANESRYQAMLGTADTMGAQAKQRVQDQGVALEASARSNAISRGLGNSTIVDSLQRGVRRDVNDQLLGIDESRNRLKLGIMENRTDASPDLNLYAGLLNVPGALDWMARQGGGSSGTGSGGGSGANTDWMRNWAGGNTTPVSPGSTELLPPWLRANGG